MQQNTQVPQQPGNPTKLVQKLKPWWGLTIIGLLSAGTVGGAVAIALCRPGHANEEADDLPEGGRQLDRP